MKLLVLAMAQKAIRDGETDRISLIDIVDSVAAESFPHFVGELSLLTIYHKEDGDDAKETVTFTLKNNDDEMAVQEQDVVFGDRIGNRTIIGVNGLVLLKPGTFSVTVQHKDRTIGTWSIPVALEA
jgi:hypothetical protein